MLQHFGKAGDGNDWGLEFMGKIVDEIFPQDLCLFQLGSHQIHAVRHLFDRRNRAERTCERQSGRKITVSEAVQNIQEPVHRFQRIAHGQQRNKGTDPGAPQQHVQNESARAQFDVTDLQLSPVYHDGQDNTDNDRR